MAESYSVTAVLKAQDSGFSKAFQSARNSMKQTTQASKTFGSGIKNTFSNMRAQVKSGSSAFKSFAGAMLLTKGISTVVGTAMNSMGGAISRFDTLNNFPKVMQQMGVSTKDSKKALDLMSKSIDGLPTSLDTMAKTAQRFLPIMKGNMEQASKSTIAMNNAFLASGASGADASRGLEQYTQMLSAGKVDMQSWKTLQETMPFALQKTAKALGVTSGNTQELYSKLQGGEITMDQLNSKFIELNDGVGGFAEVAKTATGGIGTAFTNMGNRITRALEQGIRIIDESLQSISGMSIADAINKMSSGGVKIITDVFTEIGNFMKSHASEIKQIFGAISEGIKEGLNVIESVISSIIEVVSNFFSLFRGSGVNVDVIKAVATAFTIVAGAIAVATVATTLFTAVMGVLTSPITAVSLAIGALVATFLYFYNTNSDLRNFINSTWQAIQKTFASVLKNIQNLFSGSSSLFEPLKTALNNIVNVISTVLGAITETLTPFIEIVVNVFAQIGASVLPLLQTAFESIGNVFKTFIDLVNQILPPILETFNSVFGTIKDNILPPVTEAFSQVGNGIVTVFDGIVSGIQPILPAVSSVFEAVAGFIGTVMPVILNIISTTWSAIAPIISVAIGIILPLITTAWNIIATVTGTVFKIIGTIVSTVMNVISGVIKTVTAIMQENWSGALNAMLGIGRSILNGISGIFSSVLGGIVGIVSSIGQGIASAFGNAIRVAIGLVQNVVNGIKSAFDAISNIDLFSIGKNIIEGLIGGIKDMVGAVGDAISSVVGNVKDKAKQLLGIHSPSRWFKDMIGKNIVLGLAIGIDDNAQEAISSANDLISGIQDNFTDSLQTTSDFEIHVSDQQELTSPILSRVADGLDKLSNMQVMLDTGAIVGHTGEAYDEYLGNNAWKETRYH